MSISLIHAKLANTALIYVLCLALWGFWRFVRKQGLDSGYWGALVIAEVLLLVQGGLGSAMWLIGLHPERSIHLLYGVVSALAIPGVFAYTRGRGERSEMLLYAAVMLVTVALILRATTTAR